MHETTIALSFSTVLIELKKNPSSKFTRRGWNGSGQFITLQVPDEHSKMRRPYIYMSPVDGQLVPWVASHTDLLAEDWYGVTD